MATIDSISGVRRIPKSQWGSVTSPRTKKPVGENQAPFIGAGERQPVINTDNRDASGRLSNNCQEALSEDLEAARTVSAVLFGVLTVGITIGVIGFVCSFIFT